MTDIPDFADLGDFGGTAEFRRGVVFATAVADVENTRLREDNTRMRLSLEGLDRRGGLGSGVHAFIRKALGKVSDAVAPGDA